MKNNFILRLLLAVTASVAVIRPAMSYSLGTDRSGIYVIKWQSSPVEMQVKLPTVANLSDGTSLSSNIPIAMQAWNANVGTVQLVPTLLEVGSYATDNKVNEIVMDSTVAGEGFGAGTLAITVYFTDGNDIAEADIVFNTAYTWDSYRGALRSGSYDFRRVAMHELGHVLGLEHPDEHGQSVTALMNRYVSGIDTVQADDIAGVQKLYGAPGVAQANDHFANATLFTLESSTISLSGSNIASTREPSEPNHGDVAEGHSVWWKWTPLTNGNATVTTLGSNYDTVVAVYTGASLSALTLITSNDDEETPEQNPTPSRKRTSLVTFNATGGTTYYLAVDGWGDVSEGTIPYTGSITLNLSFGGSLPPLVTSHPVNRSINAGDTAQFSVQASGTPSPSYQWQRLPSGNSSWANLSSSSTYSGVTTTTLTVSNATLAMSGDQFRCAVSNTSGTIVSNSAVLSISTVPVATVSQPAVSTYQTTTAVSVGATGNGPFVYQWYHNGLPVAGSNSNQLNVTNGVGAEYGEYFVSVTNPGGTVLSKTVSLGLPFSSATPVTDYSWINAQQVDDVVYFLFKSQIARYDLASESWLAPWPLAQTATNFYVATDAIYVASGSSVTRYDRSFASSVALLTQANPITALQQVDGYLVTIFFQYPYTTFASYDRVTGQAISSLQLVYAVMRGYSYDPQTRRIYGRTISISPSDINCALVRPDGTFGASFDSPYHGQFPGAEQTFVLGSGEKVTDNSGVVYNASDLTYAGSLGGRFTDVISDGSSGYYVLRGGRISAVNGNFCETGATVAQALANRLWRRNNNLFLFAQPATSDSLPKVEKVAASSIQPAAPTSPPAPTAGNFTSAQLLMDENGVVYIYSKLDRNIYRWSSQLRSFQPSIPIANNPNFFAYSVEARSLFFDENGYQIRRIALDAVNPAPAPCTVAPMPPTGFQTAGGLLMTALSEVRIMSLGSTGAVAKLILDGEESREYVWNGAIGRMYHFHDNRSPRSLEYHQFNQTGAFVANRTVTVNTGLTPPIRVSADGTNVVLGSGNLYDGTSLAPQGTLANSFTDAAWTGNTLHTIRSSGGRTEIQSWSTNNLQLLRNRAFAGDPVRLLTQPDGRLLLVTSVAGSLVFQVVETDDLTTVYASQPSGNKTQQTISFGALSDCNYGAAPFSISASASSGLPVNLSVASGSATVANGTVAVTGAGTVVVRASQSGNDTYDAAFNVERSFIVSKSVLVVTAQNLTRTYGAVIPAFTVSYSGFLNGDTVLALTTLPTVTTTATATSGVGTYPLTASGGSAVNYSLSYVGGTLTVSKAALTVTADNLFRVQGADNPALTLSYSGFANGETSAVLSTQPVAATSADASSPLGVYPITVSGGSAANYTLTLQGGTLTVVPLNYAGTYFGTFASGGFWAMVVRANNTATYIACLPGRQSAIVENVTVGVDGTFSVAGTEIKPLTSAVRGLALVSPEAPSPKISAAGAAFTLTGQIATSGVVTGQLTGLGETLTGAVAATTGPAQAVAGLYSSAALGTAGGATYAIVGASGQAVVVSTTPTSVGGATGTVNASGQLTATTSNNAQLVLTINSAAQTFSASLTPAGASAAIVFAGLPDTVTPVSRAVNLSVRSAAGTGSQTLIVGFVITGTGSKALLLRGIGPGLVPFGVVTAMTDPGLRLFNGAGAEVATNDDWGGSATMIDRFNAVGAFVPSATNSKDAALYNAVANGVYSFHVVASSGSPGVALAELYDSDATEGAAKVVNISARTQVGSGENILIAGFVITGNSPRTVLIRGVGPTLVPFGVTDALADPQLSLYRGGVLVGGNDDWGGTPALKSTFTNVGAGGLLSDTSKDAALLITLEPGVYSAQVSGAGGTTGVGLVEIFLMP